MEIQHKIAVITGASSGIGRALAAELAKRGATVVLSARSKEKLEEAASEIPGAFPIVADMTKPEDIEALIRQAKEKFGRIDILVNNAGQGMLASVEKTNMEEYEKIVQLNVFGVLRAMQEAIPVMREQGKGLIMNISSLVSKNYFPGLGAYASTKYALNALSLTARTELAPDGIVVSVFHPRMTATDFGANAYRDEDSPALERAGMVIDTAEQVAEKVADLIESEEPEAGMQ